jgi:hypothetical protein
LLPARLANACALVLPAAGVGIMFGEHVAAIPRPHTLTDAGTVDLLFHHSRAQADLDFAVADEAIAQVKQTLDSESAAEFPVGLRTGVLAGPSANSLVAGVT